MRRLRRRWAQAETSTPINIDWMKVLKVLGVSAGVGILTVANRSLEAVSTVPSHSRNLLAPSIKTGVSA